MTRDSPEAPGPPSAEARNRTAPPNRLPGTSGGGRFVRPPYVAVVDSGLDNPTAPLFLADLRRPEILVLEGASAAVWRGVVADEDEPFVERVAGWFDADAGQIRGDVETFVADLVRRGLLVPDGGADKGEDGPS